MVERGGGGITGNARGQRMKVRNTKEVCLSCKELSVLDGSQESLASSFTGCTEFCG